MSPWMEKAHHRKILSVFAITALVLLVGLLMFFIVCVTLRWQNVTEEGLIQDPAQDSNDSINEECLSKAAVIRDKGILQKWNLSESFSQAWKDAEGKARAPAHIYMEKDHSVAIYLFTSGLLQSSGGREIFTPRSFDSLLSEALQVLRHSQVTCLSTTYRSNTLFSPNISHRLVRFSSFTLGSDWWNSSGVTSCFEVFTCFGADVTLYSALTQTSQVLIPPYEVFTVTDAETDAQKCRVLYKLKSNMNCVYDRESDRLHQISASSVGGVWLTFIITCILIVLLLLMFVVMKVKQNSKRKAYYGAECAGTKYPGGGLMELQTEISDEHK
ncbi:ecto-ADP-ribosyltransferase 5-like [Halichoeres trimaculatus]|uniref:ecto-ADP-ribosyltransferase 5-like n=1 Tax=Halichoeres trimaculatus TaxID=147232 RepID=UPI003D9DDCF7